jgi:hypothetical protein
MEGVRAVDPVSLIIAALVAGAAAGTSDTVSSAIKDAYAGLKGLISRRFKDKPAAQLALSGHEADPATWESSLARSLADSGAREDSDVLAAALRVLALHDPTGAQRGKYNVDLRGARQAQVGDHNQQINY